MSQGRNTIDIPELMERPVNASLQPTKGRILLLSYAFPPMQVQMTPAVVKPMAALARAGFAVDVVCADSFCPELPLDHSLLPYAESTFGDVVRLNPTRGLMTRVRTSSRVLTRIPDLMAVLHESAYGTLMDMNLTNYDAVMTWSPFHSINAVMTRVRQARPNVRWIAQFSDPWVGNPLEVHRLTKIWNALNEPKAVQTADFIVHSSSYSLELMLRNHPSKVRQKTAVIPHAFDRAMYPQRPKTRNEGIVLRYVGVLYGRRSPEPLFRALHRVLARRPELRGRLRLELVGATPPEMLETQAARNLPPGTVRALGNVPFLKSLELMHDSDILVLIEASIQQNLFLASKLSDYFGAATPIVGLVPPGSSEDAFKELGAWHARPDDIDGIARGVNGAIDYVESNRGLPWCNDSFRESFSGEHVAGRFESIIERL